MKDIVSMRKTRSVDASLGSVGKINSNLFLTFNDRRCLVVSPVWNLKWRNPGQIPLMPTGDSLPPPIPPHSTPLSLQVTPLHSGVTALHSMFFLPRCQRHHRCKNALYANIIPVNTNIVPGTQAGLINSAMARIVRLATPCIACENALYAVLIFTTS